MFAYFRAPLLICKISGLFSLAQASRIAWASSMLLTLNAPTANPPE
jgi:hypothetical protein